MKQNRKRWRGCTECPSTRGNKIGVGEAVSEYRDSALVCVYIGTTSKGLGF